MKPATRSQLPRVRVASRRRRSGGAVFSAMLVVFSGLVSGACSRSPVDGRAPADNLLFISMDTTRADHLSLYGYGQPTSPHLDRIAALGVVFDSARSHVASTLPSHSSMMTGQLPPTHGVRCNGISRLPATATTLAESLRAEQFSTAAIVAAFPLERRFGLAQGFDVYDDDFASSQLTARRRAGKMDRQGRWLGHEYPDFERSGFEVTERAIDWLGRRGDRWFLFAHYFDAHSPYEPEAKYASRFKSPYDAEIASLDEQVGRLVDHVRAMPGRTLIVITADHGESLGEHREPAHNRFVYEATNRVPLVMVLEGTLPADKRVKASVGHVDLFPTVLELLGMKRHDPVDGFSLAAALRRGAEPQSRPQYLETLVWKLENPRDLEVRGLFDGRYKIVETRGSGGRREVELYDIEKDPGELHDRAATDPGRTRLLEQRLLGWSERLESEGAAREATSLDRGAVERLRSLGYL